MKAEIKKYLPKFILTSYRQFKNRLEQKENSHKPAEIVFTEIYNKKKWGSAEGEFCSGAGSADERVVSSYISAISKVAEKEGFRELTFVDLGCGDFKVGQKLIPLCSNYIGVDIVKPLIQHHQQTYQTAKIKFVSLNLMEDNLPEGEVCFVRQVLQHLSNQQINSILPKLKNYKWVFISEHYPSNNNKITPNLDKVHGSGVRVYENSGVYLTEPPFNLPINSVQLLLEVSGVGLDERIDPGVIRTFLYKPQEH
jgi:SAM-dependent methyltransferase